VHVGVKIKMTTGVTNQQSAALYMHPYLTSLYKYGRTIIAGHRHFSIHHLIPVLEHSGTGIGLLIPVPDWFRHQHLKNPSSRKPHTWAPLRISVVNKLKHYQNRGNKNMNDTYTALLCNIFLCDELFLNLALVITVKS
jgi:hypothetical protein